AAVQRHQVIAATDVGIANENLRHGAPPRDLHHLHSLVGLHVDPDLLDDLDALGQQELFGANAKRANGRRVHLDWIHGLAVQAFSTGRLASFQALSPPASTWALS